MAVLYAEPRTTINQPEIIVVDLDALNDNGLSPLHLAIKNTNLAIIQLLENKANDMNVAIYEKSEIKNGNSALHLAVETGSVDVIQHILTNGKVNVNKKNFAGHTALYLARTKTDINNNDIINLLLEHDAQELSVDEGASSSGDSFTYSNNMSCEHQVSYIVNDE